MKKTILVLAVQILLLVNSFGCSTLSHLNIFPVSKDVELGRQFDNEIRKTPRDYPILTGYPDVKAYVEIIGQRILASPEIKYKGQYAYKFEIIHDDSTVNAFCTPGGYVYVYTGLLKFVDNEATLAGGKMGESGTQAATVVAGLGMLKYSRSDEDEADEYSFRYLQATEYYPGAIKYFFEKIGENRSSSSLERLLSTHPLAKDRLAHVNNLLADAGNPKPSESNIFSEKYKAFKKKLP